MKKKAFNKICACVLIVSLIIGLIPNAVKAEGSNSGTSDTEEVNNITNEFGETILTEKPKVLCELVEEREEKVKHFLMSNHSVQVVMYSEPVHYIEDGEWKDIDSTLTFEEAQHPEDFSGYINKQGDFSVKIAENSSEEKLVQIVNKDYNLGFQLVSEEIDSGENISGENVSDETAETLQEDEEDNTISNANSIELIEENTVNTETITEIGSNQTAEDNIEIDSQTNIIPEVTEIPRDTSVVAEIKQKQETDNSKFFESNHIKYDQAFEVNTVSDTVVYNGITDNRSTDIEYKVTGLGLKENIIVNEKQEAYRYIFHLSADNLEVKLEDNQVTAADPKTGEIIYIIPAPFMYDAENDFSNDVTYSLEKVDSGYQLIVEADERWINSKETVFPVTIDPIITTKTSQNAIKSTFISSKKANENFYEYKMLLAGVDSYAYNKCRTLIKFQLPDLNPGDIIVDAKLNLNQYSVEAYASNTPNMAVNAYRITSSWNEKSVTWSSMPSVDYNEIDYSYISRSDGNTLKTKIFDITQAAKEWYDGDRVNCGIMLRTNNEETKDTVDSIYAKYWSEKYNEVTEAYPMILLEYRNTKGLEAYYSYTELSAGTAGAAYVSNYTGNLVFTQNSISTSGLKMPASVYFVYNTNNAYTNTNNTVQETGYGWKLNIQQYVVSSQKFGLSGDAYAEYPYVYVDEDGTEHYIKKVVAGSKTTYEDEDGLGLTLVKNSDGI